MSQQLDMITGTTESRVDWRMLNMKSELVASSLTTTLGGGLHSVLGPYWKFSTKNSGDIVPINHILKFETFGHRCPLRSTLRYEYQIRLVTTRNSDGTLKRGHLVMVCHLFPKEEPASQPIARSEFWLALTRPFAAPDQRKPKDVPAELKCLTEHTPTDQDLISRDIESYRCTAPECVYTTQPLVFHMDQSDLYQHINTNKYIDRALDLLSLQCYKAGGDVGQLRFREITIYFRKPFVPGQAAEAELDFVQCRDVFHGSVRFYHCNTNGSRSERISMAMETRGPLTKS